MLKSKYRMYIDVETTGFCHWRNDVVSIAIVVTDLDFHVKDEFYETARPSFGRFYTEKSEEIHGFSKSEMMTFQEPRKLCINILKFLLPYKDENNVPNIFVQHALRQFDWLFVETLFRKNELEFSWWKVAAQDRQESTILKGRKAGYKKNKLNQWADRLGLELNHHDALDDAKMCLEIDKFLEVKTL